MEVEGIEYLPTSSLASVAPARFSLNKKKRWLLADQIKEAATKSYDDSVKDDEMPLDVKKGSKRIRKRNCKRNEKTSLCEVQLQIVDDTGISSNW